MPRDEIYYADLDPTRGSEQAGLRPVLVVQRDSISRYTSTVVIVPFTSSQVDRYRQLPSCVFVAQGVGGLTADSVALCHQVRVITQERLQGRLGALPGSLMREVEKALALTLGFQRAG